MLWMREPLGMRGDRLKLQGDWKLRAGGKTPGFSSPSGPREEKSRRFHGGSGKRRRSGPAPAHRARWWHKCRGRVTHLTPGEQGGVAVGITP